MGKMFDYQGTVRAFAERQEWFKLEGEPLCKNL